jgi:hypothetical protein
VGGSLYPSHITNTTFRNIFIMSNMTSGGILYVNTPSYDNFTLERCIFASNSRANYGGALFLAHSSPYVIIISCRFENNSVSINNRGLDIYSNSDPCLSAEYAPFESCTTPTSASVSCHEDLSVLPSCEEKIVCYCWLFINFFFIFSLHFRRGVTMTMARAVVTIV